jgi:TolB-like protein
MSEETQRKLAAIISADVVGYSRLMGEDEAGTLAVLRKFRAGLFDPTVSEHRGEIVKSMGDGWLVAFDSAADAVTCAIKVQEKLTGHEVLKVRIGLHIGDVTFADGDIFGDGVNVASRLQEIAVPGAIVISETAKRSIDGKLAADFNDLGAQELKNITDPIAAFGWSMSEVAARPATTTNDEKPSIAVLPFDNMSGDPDQEFFADGMAEEIITALSKLRWFFVIARNSTFAYKGKAADVRQVARELGVRYILEGSVRRAGQRVRIAAQLIDGESGNHLWAERYDREVTDIFAVQDEIAAAVVGAIEPQLHAAESLRIASRPPESLDAWGSVVRGLWHLGRFTREDNEEALKLLRQAVSLSPDYAKAHAVLAFAEARRVLFGEEIEETLKAALGIAEAAVALDGEDPWGHFAVGYIICFESRYEEAIACYRRAIALNENFALAHGNIAGAAGRGGRGGRTVLADESAGRFQLRLQAFRCDRSFRRRPL